MDSVCFLFYQWRNHLDFVRITNFFVGPLPWYMKTDKISIDETSNNMSSKYRAPQDDPMFLVEKLLSNRKTKNPESDRRRQSRKKKSTQIQASDEMKHRRHHVHKVHHYSQKQSSSTTRR